MTFDALVAPERKYPLEGHPAVGLAKPVEVGNVGLSDHVIATSKTSPA